MELDYVLRSLCIRDRRNPEYKDVFNEDDNPIPRENCYCDSCFYGRDALAVEVLCLMDELKKEKEATRCTKCDTGSAQKAT